MTSYIDCDDLRTLSVQDPLNADLQRELSLSLFRHIAQASANAHNARSHSSPIAGVGFVPATTPTPFAPATTPTTTNSIFFGSNLVSHNGPVPSRRRDPSLVRTGSGEMEMVEEDWMQTENEDVNADHGDDRPQAGRAAPAAALHYPFTSPTTTTQSCFTSSDPFFLSVSELQATANQRRLLEAKPFAASSSLRVTPNPIQFGPPLNNNPHSSSPFSRDANIPFYASQAANNHMQMQMDASLLQYR